MAVARSTSYAPEVYKHLNGIVLACKPSLITFKEFIHSLQLRLTDHFNELEPRPISRKLVITGGIDEEKQVTEIPNLADHPLVVGPRYLPWELRIGSPFWMSYRTSGVVPILAGKEASFFNRRVNAKRIPSVYHITGRFGYITDNFFSDGKIQDKSTFRHIKAHKVDQVLAKIESSQHERLFDAAKVPIHSQEAYELAKAWPSMPPKMASWPIIYRIRCIHFQLPHFKIEVTCINEREGFLAQLPHDIGLILKSGAYTESIRRVKIGPFDIGDALTEGEWELNTVVDRLGKSLTNIDELYDTLKAYKGPVVVRNEHIPEFARDRNYSSNQPSRSYESKPEGRSKRA